jgi:hypothetical protein
LSSFDEDLRDVDSHSRSMKGRLVHAPGGELRHPFVVAAGKSSFSYLVDWDAVWGGASFLVDGDPEPLRGSIFNILEHVGPDGKGSRVLGPAGPVRALAFTNRPFVAAGAHALCRELDSAEWLGAEGYARLHSLVLYWHRNRRSGRGLLRWLAVDEGFADNGLANWTFERSTVEAVDLNAQMILEHAAAARIAEMLGLTEEAEEHSRLGRGLAAGIGRYLWNKGRGTYQSVHAPDAEVPTNEQQPRFIDRLTYTNLWPLWLGLADKERARRVIERYVLAPKHFLSEHGLRSTSASEPYYNNARGGTTLPYPPPEPEDPWPLGIPIGCSNWQGPIWSLTNYLLILALARYGYAREARSLCEKVVGLLANDARTSGEGAFHENYHAETGEPLNFADGFGSWSLMIRHLPADLDATEKGEGCFFSRGLDLPKPAIRS